MNKSSKIQYFESEGRENLPSVIKSIKGYLKALIPDERPSWVIFLTSRGEGPMLAYHALNDFKINIAAVTFSAAFSIKTHDGHIYRPEIPERVAKFFRGVDIPVITARLPFDPIDGARIQNAEMELLTKAIGIFGSGIPLAIQAVLQACDVGLVKAGEQVIAASGDCALLVTAASSGNFLNKQNGLSVNEIICKPRNRKFSQHKTEALPQALPKQA